MPIVKTPGEDSLGVTADLSVEGLGGDPGKQATEKLGKAAATLNAASEVAATLNAVSEVTATVNMASEVAATVKALSGGDLSSPNLPGLASRALRGVVPEPELPTFVERAITSSIPKPPPVSFLGDLGAKAEKAAAALTSLDGGKNLEIDVASGDALDVRTFSVEERLSSLFKVNLVAVSDNPSIDFDAVVGQPARFLIHAGAHSRLWSGLCNHLEQVRVEASGVSTYEISIVPLLWLLTQRKNHRMFQHISEPDIALELLEEWDIEPEIRIDRGAYKKRKYRVQYGESDFAFMSRMLEDAGITYLFEQAGEETKLVFADAPHASTRREGLLTFLDDTTMVQKHKVEFATHVRMGKRVRPGKYTLRDHDYRRSPGYKLMASAKGGQGIEEKLERYQYTPGAFLFGADQGETTPVADDKGKTRTDEKEAALLAQKRLDAKRGSAKVCSFETNAYDLLPGSVIGITGHPNEALGEDKSLLVVASSLHGESLGEWSHRCEARGTEIPFRPALVTPKPKVNGVESATVVGPAGEEIHTDEFGRVRVHFHWDRESRMDDNSSCWIHVSQSWGGTGFGGVNLPRIGQEVLVDFLGGDPDRPVIVGRVYTNLQKVPYKLPENKTQSGWRSNSTGGTGGYNEIMFEDSQGNEHVRMQAEKDQSQLVKNDESCTVGRDRNRRVRRNESVTVGKNRTRHVVQSERVSIGQSQSIMVGVNRSAKIGVVDATSAGTMHVVSISPPGGGNSAKVTMTDKKIVLDTGAGATITMDQNKIMLLSDQIDIIGNKVSIFGTTTAELRSNGITEVDGKPVQLNGPGLFAGRVTEKAPATIETGVALVLIGGASFPMPVVRQPDGSLKVGNNITVFPGEGRYPDFQNRVMRDLGIMASTPAGAQRLSNLDNNPGGHQVNIREYSARYANDPQFGPNNSVNSPIDSANAAPTRDRDGNLIPGRGSGSEVGYNPDIVLGPNGGPPEPSDAVLFHELGHADHAAHGINLPGESLRSDPNLAGYHNREEWQTIEGGVNQPGGTQVRGVPNSPSENNYLDQRNYPYHRRDHSQGYIDRIDGRIIQ